MEEMSFAVAVPLRVSNPVCDNPKTVNHMDVSRFKLMGDAGWLSNSVTKVSSETVVSSDVGHKGDNLDDEVGIVKVTLLKQDKEGNIPLLDMISEYRSTSDAGDEVLVPEIEEDDSLSLEGD